MQYNNNFHISVQNVFTVFDWFYHAYFDFAECLVSVVAKNKKYWRYFFNLLLCARIYRSHGSVRELNLELLCTYKAALTRATFLRAIFS